MINFFKNLFRKRTPKQHQAVFGSCYGVLTGKYVGEMFVYIDDDKSNMQFLSIPTMKNRVVPIDKYKYAISNGVLDYIERLPKNERRVCKIQFENNKETK